jgi:hypothetical protein
VTDDQQPVQETPPPAAPWQQTPPPAQPQYAPPPPGYGQPPAGYGQPGQTPARMPDEARKAALAQHIATAVATQGARVESQSEFQAVLLTGNVVNHVLHAILSLFSCGLWAIVWIILVVTGGVKRHIVQVDDWGNVRVQHV